MNNIYKGIKVIHFRNTLLVVCIILGLQACSSKAYLSTAATRDFKIDGHRSEWTGRFKIPQGERFGLGVSNDKNYLYVAISSIDGEFMRQLARGGITLWLDVKGGKRQNLGIKLDGMAPHEKLSARVKKRQYEAAEFKEGFPFSERPSPFNGDLTLIVLDTKAGKSLGPADLLASANSSEGELFIEYQIPLAMLGQNVSIEYIGLGLESIIKRSPRERRPEGMNLESGGRSNGMGGNQRGGGQRSAMKSNHSRSGIDTGDNSVELWMKIQLSP